MSYNYYKKNNYRSLLDDKFNFDKAYFYKDVSNDDWKKIESIVNDYFKDGSGNVQILDKIDPIVELDKGVNNVEKLRALIDKYEDKHSKHENIVKLMTNTKEKEGIYISKIFQDSILDQFKIPENSILVKFDKYSIDNYGYTNFRWLGEKSTSK